MIRAASENHRRSTRRRRGPIFGSATERPWQVSLTLCVALLVMGVAPAAWADAPFSSLVVDTGTADSSWLVRSADLDGDGDLDAFTASWLDDEVNWYENDGQNPPSFTPRNVSNTAIGAASVEPADVDGDGDLDLISAWIIGDTVAWHENDGLSPPGWTQRIVSTVETNARHAIGLDVDGDGDTDIVVAAESADEVAWLENDGLSPPGFTRRVISNTAPWPTSVHGADLDADGDLDLVSTYERSGSLVWFESDGAQPPTFTERTITNGAPSALWADIADFDRDGRPDIAMASIDQDRVSWWRNDGGSPPTFTGTDVTTGANGVRSVLAADVDADGDVDLVSASEFGDEVQFHENLGEPSPTFVNHVIPYPLDGASSVTSGDLDGDGDTDVVGVGFDDLDVLGLVNERIHRVSDYRLKQVLSGARVGASSVAAADLDADGALDVVSSSAGDDTIAWYRNELSGGGGLTEQVVSTSVTGVLDVGAWDLDRDGDRDLLSAGGTAGAVSWWESDGASPPVFAEVSIDGAAGVADAVEVGDVNGDGAPDVVAAVGGANRVTLYASDGAADPAFASQDVDATATGASDVAVADIDGDGDQDVAATAAGIDTVAWYENDGNASPGFTRRVVDAGATGASSLAIADVDRDGLLDLVATSAGDGRLAWYENDGASPPAFVQHVVDFASTGASDVSVGDIDMDGDVDLVVTAASGDELVVYESDGAALPTFVRIPAGSAIDGASATAVADIDSDGYLDIAAAGADEGTVSWFPNLGGQADIVIVPGNFTTLGQGILRDFATLFVQHLGKPGDSDLELAELSLFFGSAPGVPLSDAEANALIYAFWVYRDDGDSSFNLNDDPLVQEVIGPLLLDQGEFPLPMPDGDPLLAIGPNEAVRFWVVVELQPNAASQSPNTLVLTIDGAASVVEDASADIPLRLRAPMAASSAVVTAVTQLPKCADGIDNDSDSFVDWDGGGVGDPDPQCDGRPWVDREKGGRCGLGFEAGLAAMLVAGLRRRRHRLRAARGH